MANKLTRFIIFSAAVLSLAVPTRALAADYTIEIPSAQDGAFGTSTVNVAGQSLPSVAISAIPGETTQEYVDYKLYINDSQKTHWTNPRETINYSWKLCEANTNTKPTDGVYTVKVLGIDSFSRDNTLATTTFNLVGLNEASCTSNTGGAAAISITPSVKVPNSPKIITFTLSSTGLTTSEVCSKYTVILTVTNNGSESQKGMFCSPSAPSLQTVDWNSTDSTPGQTYTVQAKALGANNSGNLTSTALTYTIQSDGTPNTGSNGGNGGSGGNVSLKPLKFIVPDLSRLSGKSGLALRVELINIIIDYIIVIVSMFAIIAFLYSGVMYGLSFGDPAKAEKAKKNLLWAIWGVVIVLLSVVLLSIVSQITRTLV